MDEEYLFAQHNGKTMLELSDEVREATGLNKDLNPLSYSPRSGKREVAKAINAAIHLRSGGHHVDWVENQVSGKVIYETRVTDGKGWSKWEGLDKRAELLNKDPVNRGPKERGLDALPSVPGGTSPSRRASTRTSTTRPISGGLTRAGRAPRLARHR